MAVTALTLVAPQVPPSQQIRHGTTVTSDTAKARLFWAHVITTVVDSKKVKSRHPRATERALLLILSSMGSRRYRTGNQCAERFAYGAQKSCAIDHCLKRRITAGRTGASQHA